jgi:homoserine dehydrogenase
MESTGCSMHEAIADACAKGYAEADPAADLDGVDAAAKLAILCMLGFGLRISPEAIDTRTTARIGADELRDAARRGGAIRQIAHAQYDHGTRTLTAWVAPIYVDGASIFARTTGPRNAAVIAGEFAGELTMAGTGAGGEATAVAALGDLLTIARDRAAIVPAPIVIEPAHLKGFIEPELAEAV